MTTTEKTVPEPTRSLKDLLATVQPHTTEDETKEDATKRLTEATNRLKEDAGNAPSIIAVQLGKPPEKIDSTGLTHGVEDLRPNPIKPHPEEPVCGEEPKATGALAPQDAHLMSKGNELKFKVGAATNTEREQGNEGGKNRDHTRNGMAVAHKSLGFSALWSFEHGHAIAKFRV